MKKVSLIVTILNEEKSIISLLDSINKQTLLPSEVIITDGGSGDKTFSLLKNYIKKHESLQNKNLQIKIFIKKGNRSVGRNYAIKKAKNEFVAITDAGCILDRNWLKELVKKQEESGAKVVAGYYKVARKSLAKKPLTPFEKAVVLYVLVMPNKVNENNFLPATRSVLLSKKIWEKVGKFDESLSDNEDYAFAKKIQANAEAVEMGASSEQIVFAKKAVVGWMPNSTLKSFAKMIFRFARGDVFAGIIRPKVLLIFIRYLFGFLLFIWGVIKWPMPTGFWILFGLIPVLLLIYAVWSITKNYAYARRSWYWFPVLQVVSDLAVMWGSACGLVKRISFKKATN